MAVKKYKTKEQSIHRQVATYLKLQYPHVIFRTDFAAGIKMTIGQAVKHKALQSCASYPDLFIAHPANGYHGLFIELKRDISEVMNKNGKIKSSPHIQAQSEILNKLSSLGYMAMWGFGFEHTRIVIDAYLNPKNKHSEK